MNEINIRLFLVSGLVAMLALPSVARSDVSTDDLFELSMDELLNIEVEIATGKPQKLSRAPAVANVITASEIEAMGVTSFEQVLEMIPGVHVYPDPIARLDAHFSIRGIHTSDNSQVLVLVNGHDVTYIATGSTPQNFHMPVANISRIEVMRSPGSALYGADAFGGVINIITKTNTGLDGSDLGWRQGSFNTQDIWLQHGASLNDEWNLSFSLESSRSDGDDGRVVNYRNEDLVPLASPVISGSGLLATDYDYTNTEVVLSNQEWKFSFWNWDLKKAGVGQGATQIVDPEGFDMSELYLFDIQHESHAIHPDWTINSRLSYELNDADSHFTLYPGTIGDPGATQRKGTFSLRSDYSGFDNHSFLLGVGSEWIAVDPREVKNFGTPSPPGVMVDVTGSAYAFMTRQTRTVNHLFLQDEWTVNDDWAVTAGVRYDDYSDFGNTTNPRIAIVWMGQPKLTAKLLYGRAFRAPAFSELYFTNNPASLGNINVTSESIDTYEAVFDYRPVSEVNLVLSLFSYRIEDLINRSFGMPAANTGKQKGSGFELEGNWHVNARLQLRGFYAFQNAEDGVTGADVPNAPQQQFYASAHWGFQPQWFLGSQLKWIADRKRAAGDPRTEIADYTIVDATLRRLHLLPNMDFTFSIRNLFDEDARAPTNFEPAHSQGATIVGDYPLASRSFYAEIRFNY